MKLSLSLTVTVPTQLVLPVVAAAEWSHQLFMQQQLLYYISDNAQSSLQSSLRQSSRPQRNAQMVCERPNDSCDLLTVVLKHRYLQLSSLSYSTCPSARSTRRFVEESGKWSKEYHEPLNQLPAACRGNADSKSQER